jgi:hypothetical protein
METPTDVDHRLIMQFEFAALYGGAKFFLQLASIVYLRQHRRIKKAEIVSSCRFGRAPKGELETRANASLIMAQCQNGAYLSGWRWARPC